MLKSLKNAKKIEILTTADVDVIGQILSNFP